MKKNECNLENIGIVGLMKENNKHLKLEKRKKRLRTSIIIFLIYIVVTLIQLFYGIFSHTYDIRIILVLYSRFGIGCIATLILLVFYIRNRRNRKFLLEKNQDKIVTFH